MINVVTLLCHTLKDSLPILQILLIFHIKISLINLFSLDLQCKAMFLIEIRAFLSIQCLALLAKHQLLESLQPIYDIKIVTELIIGG